MTSTPVARDVGGGRGGGSTRQRRDESYEQQELLVPFSPLSSVSHTNSHTGNPLPDPDPHAESAATVPTTGGVDVTDSCKDPMDTKQGGVCTNRGVGTVGKDVNAEDAGDVNGKEDDTKERTTSREGVASSGDVAVLNIPAAVKPEENGAIVKNGGFKEANISTPATLEVSPGVKESNSIPAAMEVSPTIEERPGTSTPGSDIAQLSTDPPDMPPEPLQVEVGGGSTHPPDSEQAVSPTAILIADDSSMNHPGGSLRTDPALSSAERSSGDHAGISVHAEPLEPAVSPTSIDSEQKEEVVVVEKPNTEREVDPPRSSERDPPRSSGSEGYPPRSSVSTSGVAAGQQQEEEGMGTLKKVA
jgi:hypothetical protein